MSVGSVAIGGCLTEKFGSPLSFPTSRVIEPRDRARGTVFHLFHASGMCIAVKAKTRLCEQCTSYSNFTKISFELTEKMPLVLESPGTKIPP